MSTSIASAKILARVRSDAFRRLSALQRQHSSLYVDMRLHDAGAVLGPQFQRTSCDRPTVVVFADHEPFANFGHDCEYLLYDASGVNYRTVPARFPPFGPLPSSTLTAFHQPARVASGRLRYVLAADTALTHEVSPSASPLVAAAPAAAAKRGRFAIVFSGMSDGRHLNDAELCYRVLTERYQFSPDDIRVQFHLGEMRPTDPEVWAGDGTRFSLKIDGPGTREGMQSALAALRNKMKQEDLLFLFTTGHGNNHGQGTKPYLCEGAENFGAEYKTDEFSQDLAELPRLDAMIVVMQQCCGGAFIGPISASAKVNHLSIATAAAAEESSFALKDNEQWDSFTWHWFSAHQGTTPDGITLESDPDLDKNGTISTNEAFKFALNASTANPDDSPQFFGEKLTLF